MHCLHLFFFLFLSHFFSFDRPTNETVRAVRIVLASSLLCRRKNHKKKERRDRNNDHHVMITARYRNCGRAVLARTRQRGERQSDGEEGRLSRAQCSLNSIYPGHKSRFSEIAQRNTERTATVAAVARCSYRTVINRLRFVSLLFLATQQISLPFSERGERTR